MSGQIHLLPLHTTLKAVCLTKTNIQPNGPIISQDNEERDDPVGHEGHQIKEDGARQISLEDQPWTLARFTHRSLLLVERGRGSLAPTLLTHLYLQVFVSLVPTKSKISAQLYLQGWGGVGWGGDDNVQVRSKTDLSIHKTKGWGGVGWE